MLISFLDDLRQRPLQRHDLPQLQGQGSHLAQDEPDAAGADGMGSGRGGDAAKGDEEASRKRKGEAGVDDRATKRR